MDFANSGRWKV